MEDAGLVGAGGSARAPAGVLVGAGGPGGRGALVGGVGAEELGGVGGGGPGGRGALVGGVGAGELGGVGGGEPGSTKT